MKILTILVFLLSIVMSGCLVQGDLNTNKNSINKSDGEGYLKTIRYQFNKCYIGDILDEVCVAQFFQHLLTHEYGEELIYFVKSFSNYEKKYLFHSYNDFLDKTTIESLNFEHLKIQFNLLILNTVKKIKISQLEEIEILRENSKKEGEFYPPTEKEKITKVSIKSYDDKINKLKIDLAIAKETLKNYNELINN